MTFTDKIEAQTPLSTDHSLIKEWLDSDTARHLQSLKGHTAMYSGILAAEKRLEPTLPGDAIYIVTDGGENSSATSGSNIETVLQASGVRLFAFLIVSNGRMGDEELAGVNELQQLVRSSGGFISGIAPTNARLGAVPFDSGLRYDNTTMEQIRASTQRLGLQIAAFYFLTFRPPESPRKHRHMDVKIVGPGGRPREDLTVIYSHRLPECEVGSAQE